MIDASRHVGARALAALLLCAALAVLHTWPLASAPGTLSRNDNKDTVLNTWALAWVAHALVTAPSQVLSGNIFHPERNTVAFSDPVIVPGLLSVPVRALGASPELTYNLSLLLGYLLSAWAMQWLAWRWTGHFGASLVAGSLFAFNAHSLVSMGHIQAIHAYGLPLLLVGLDGLCRPDARRLWHGLLVGVATAILALTSGYLAIFGIVCGLIVVAVRWRELWQAPWRPLIAASLAGALVMALPVLPVLRAYREMQATHGFVRSLDLVAAMSANGTAYLATPARVHERWARGIYQTGEPKDSLFPGVVATLLALAGLVLWHEHLRDGRVRIALGLVVVGLVLSFGPATPVYTVFYAGVPFASGVRAASRFGVLFLSGLAVLAAYGVAAVSRRWPRVATTASVVALVAVNAEAFRGPVPFVPAGTPSPIYTTLAGLPDGVVVEMPFWWRPIDIPRNANYMLASTAHWKPLLNGYSGFTPASYRRRADILWYFPFRAASFDELDHAGVRYVVLHLVEYGSQRQEALDLIEASGRWRIIERRGDIVLYARVR
ncbi:hypothetical protein [Luteitalea sp.]|uniref:hypothetical protein n=1 Tax=Luteitalea sp. TaxID=2004800 RepID=UPI0025C45236|nr:hypothetical protein [Luteitalea sp.]